MSDDTTRVEKLADCCRDILLDASAELPPEAYNKLMRHRQDPPGDFEEKFRRYLAEKGVRDLVKWLDGESLIEQLDSLDASEYDAKARYDAMQQQGSLPNTEMPVRFDEFSIQDLIDFKLDSLRHQWLEELLETQGEADKQLKWFEEQVQLETDTLNELRQSLQPNLKQFNDIIQSLENP